MKRTWLVLNNENAGGVEEGLTARVGDALLALGDDVDLVGPDSLDELGVHIDRLRDGDRIVVIGGDGTVMRAVDVMMRARLSESGLDVPLGVIPAGTGNFFARALGIPLDFADAVATLERGVVRSIDVGQCGNQFFTLGVGVGLAERFVTDAETEEKERFGFGAYLWNILTASRGPELEFLFESPSGRSFRAKGHGLVVANAMGMTEALPFGNEVVPDDGRLDVFVMEGSGVVEFAKLAASMSFPSADRGGDDHFMGVDFVMDVQPRMPIQIDGDSSSQSFPVRIRTHPRHLDVLVPIR